MSKTPKEIAAGPLHEDWEDMTDIWPGEREGVGATVRVAVVAERTRAPRRIVSVWLGGGGRFRVNADEAPPEVIAYALRRVGLTALGRQVAAEVSDG